MDSWGAAESPKVLIFILVLWHGEFIIIILVFFDDFFIHLNLRRFLSITVRIPVCCWLFESTKISHLVIHIVWVLFSHTVPFKLQLHQIFPSLELSIRQSIEVLAGVHGHEFIHLDKSV